MDKIIRSSTIALSLDVLLKGQLRFLSSNYEIIALSGEDEHLRIVADREKVRVANVPMRRNISPYHDFISLCRLIKLFLKEKPRIVHSITPKAGLLTMLAGWLTGVPIRIHTFTGLIFPTKSGFIKTLLIKMDQLLCLAATHVYPEGNGVKNDLKKYKITRKPLKVLANGNVNGIDLAYFSPHDISNELKVVLRKQLGISESDFVFIFVGRLVGDKGINELVTAFSKLNLLRVKLIFVGSLEDKSDPLDTATIEEISINENIISVGFQKDIRPYLAISHVLAFPSYREGFPNVVLQAGAMGLPSIVTDINGSNEIIKEGLNGIIIPVKDAVSLKNAMKRIATDNFYYSTLAENARKNVGSKFEQSKVWGALLNEYKKLTHELSEKESHV